MFAERNSILDAKFALAEHIYHMSLQFAFPFKHINVLLCVGSKLSVGAFIEQFNVSMKYSSPPQ